MGEPVRISPRVALPKRPLASDDSRPVTDLVGRFRIKPKQIELEGQRRGTDLGGFTVLEGAEASLTLSPVEALKLGFALRQGDLIILLEPAADIWPRWSALAPQSYSTGQILLPLTREA